MWLGSLGQEGSLKEKTTIHSSILAWKNPMHRGVWQPSPWGCKESDTTATEPTCTERDERKPPHSISGAGLGVRSDRSYPPLAAT